MYSVSPIRKLMEKPRIGKANKIQRAGELKETHKQFGLKLRYGLWAPILYFSHMKTENAPAADRETRIHVR